MKTTRIILSVLLTFLLIVVGIATEVLAIIDLTAINPNFYKNTLRQLGFYESMRTVLVNQHKVFIDDQPGLLDDQKDDALKIFDKGLDKNEFAISLGAFVGDSVGFLLYNEGNAEIPIHLWIEGIEEEIMASEMVQNDPNMEKILKATLTEYLKGYEMAFKSRDNIKDFIYLFTPTPKIKDNMDRFLWVVQYWIKWLHYALYIGIASIVVLLALLLIVWRKNRGVVYKIFGVLFIVNSTIFILSGAGMFVSITLANVMNKIPPSLASHTEFLQNAINPFGILSLIVGIMMLAIGIGILILGGALTRKKAESNKTQNDDKQITAVTDDSKEIPIEEIPETIEETETITESDTEE